MEALWTYFSSDVTDEGNNRDDGDGADSCEPAKRPKLLEPQEEQQQQQQQQASNNLTCFQPYVVPFAPAPATLGWQPPPRLPQVSSAAVAASIPHPVPAFSQGIMPAFVPSQSLNDVKPSAAEERADNRRKRNAEYARKSRERKKNCEMNLSLEIRHLQQENDQLRAIVKNQLSEKEAFIIGDCCYHSSKLLGRSDFELIESLAQSRESFVLTDPRMPDNPIVYVSCAFLKLTRYAREQVIGRNCRFLQGIHTDHTAVKSLREAIEKGKDVSVCLLNYKADGTPFWNHTFVAALHDRQNRIVNYVGVSSEISKPIFAASAVGEGNDPHIDDSEKVTDLVTSHQKHPKEPAKRILSTVVAPAACAPATAELNPMPSTLDSEELDIIDWAELAAVLEAEYGEEDSKGMSPTTNGFRMPEVGDSMSDTDIGVKQHDDDSTSVVSASQDDSYLVQFFHSPREFVTRTLRSELIDSLLKSNGDVSDRRFVAALDVLSQMFRSTNRDNVALSSVLNGSWKSICQPSNPYSYGGCLGANENGDFVYTLGKMCFNMFQPGNLRCTIQNTMSYIAPVCTMDKAPTSAPWSLRRELALQDPDRSLVRPDTTLKSYDIVIGLTLEPGQFKAQPNETIPSPPCRLRAAHRVRGYFLPDPVTPNRLTVWFTGGQLAPVSPPPPNVTFDGGEIDSDLAHDAEYGTQNDWINLFAAAYKRTWSESLSVMGAKVFLGAELPQKLEADGSMSYSLHRPYGGHGKGYVDVLYVDQELLVTKGNSGTVHVLMRRSLSD